MLRNSIFFFFFSFLGRNHADTERIDRRLDACGWADVEHCRVLSGS